MLQQMFIGLYFFFIIGRKTFTAYKKVFSEFEKKIQADATLDKSQKQEIYKAMLYQNSYKIVETSSTKVVGERKIFDLALMALGLGAFYVGGLFYIIYYLYFQKPHRVEFRV